MEKAIPWRKDNLFNNKIGHLYARKKRIYTSIYTSHHLQKLTIMDYILKCIPNAIKFPEENTGKKIFMTLAT